MVGTDQICHDIIGQRVHVAGRINSQNYWSEDGKLRQKIIFNCNLFRPLPNDIGHSDLNRVRLQARISSKIHNDNPDHSSFTMKTARLRSVVSFITSCIAMIPIYWICDSFFFHFAEVEQMLNQLRLNVIVLSFEIH